jgi:hypothetical protein
MNLHSTFRLIVLKILNIDLYAHVSLRYSMKRLPSHTLLGKFSESNVLVMDRPFSSQPLRVSVPERHIYLAKNLKISGEAALIFDGQVLVEESTTWPPEIILSQERKPKRESPGSISGMNIPLGNASYYHFIMENLGKALALIEEFPGAAIVAPASKSRYFNETLELLSSHATIKRYRGVAEVESVILVDSSETLGRPQPREVKALRNFGVAKSSPKDFTSKPYRRIYVSRKNSSRALPHEIEVENLLSQHGFEITYSEDMSISEQLSVFSEAAVVIGPHGAGLVNIVFAAEGCKVVEIFDERWPNLCFEILAKECGHSFHRILHNGNPEDAEGSIIKPLRAYLSSLG